MSYATPADLLVRYDARLLGDLVQDANVRLTSAQLLTDANVIAALLDASGLIESACFVGQRYTSANLNGLTGNSLGLIKRLTCDFAFAFLRMRRGYDYEQFPLVKESYKLLDRLRLGERVFDVAEVEAKGNPTSNVISLATILAQNKVSTQFHFFPLIYPISTQ